MDIRPTEPDDADGVGSVFERSLRASYALSPAVIDELVGAYSGDALAERVDGAGVQLVAVVEDEVVGFAEGEAPADGVGTIRWLHVAPGARGEGVGTALFEATHEALLERGADRIRAVVLADNQEGDEFFERFALEVQEETAVEHAGVEFRAVVYTRGASDAIGAPRSAAIDLHGTVATDGQELAVDDEPVPGSEAPLFRTIRDDGTHYGFLCANCGSTETAMDELERIECGACGNIHRPDDWDDAYL